MQYQVSKKFFFHIIHNIYTFYVIESHDGSMDPISILYSN